ncbi:MAG: hypothetical protein JW776_06600 [Candidatus Lokiarchaeota archaeon]|nr:hypothetical protein [Candidatus Lokiarchaeota archaeon]
MSKRNNINVKQLKDQISMQVNAELESIDDVEVLKEKRDELNQQTKQLGQQRREIEDEWRINRERAFEYKTKRDELNAVIQDLKNEKKVLYNKLRDLKTELKNAKQDEESRRKTEKNKKGPTLKKVVGQIRHLEKKIITDTLDIKEENDIIQQIQKLEVAKAELEAQRNASMASVKVQKDIAKLRKELDKFNIQIQKNSEESQNYHVLMMELFKENDMKRKELDRIQAEFIQSKITADMYHNKYKEMRTSQKKRKITRIAGGKLSKKMQHQIQEMTLQDALDKKKKGEKLNIFEARALFESSGSSEKTNE